MAQALKTKKGYWGKMGQVSGNSNWPGGYKGYTYFRDAPDSYPKTAQQTKVGEAGRLIGKECKGKHGADFTACRHEVFKKVGLA